MTWIIFGIIYLIGSIVTGLFVHFVTDIQLSETGVKETYGERIRRSVVAGIFWWYVLARMFISRD